MDIKKIIYLSLISLLFGLLLFAYQFEYIIIRFPWRTASLSLEKSTKKNVSLHYWHNHTWHQEKEHLMWPDQPAHALTILINAWLSLAQEKNGSKTTLEVAILDPHGQELYISFDSSPFQPQQSSFEKWMFIEGLLKTIHELFPTIYAVQFLVHHKPLQDGHLDFSNAWPSHGFLA